MKRDKEKEVVLCASPALLLPWCRGSGARQGLQLPDRSRQDNRGLPPPGVRPWLLFLHSHPAREVEVGPAILRCCSSHASKG